MRKWLISHMYILFHVFSDESEQTDLSELLSKQREFGERLISYPQALGLGLTTPHKSA